MQPNQVRLSDAEQFDRGNYQAISRLALLALALGLLSALALAHPVLWFVPLSALATAMFALTSIAGDPQNLTGRKFALTGLALALFLGTLAPTQRAAQRVLIARNAREFSEHWLDLIRRGEFYEAHQWMQPTLYRLTADADLAEHYKMDADAKAGLEEFLSEEPLKTFAALGESGRLRFVRTLGTAGNAKETLTVQHFEVDYETDSAHPLTIRISVERKLPARRKSAQWRVQDVRPLDPGE